MEAGLSRATNTGVVYAVSWVKQMSLLNLGCKETSLAVSRFNGAWVGLHQIGSLKSAVSHVY